jgi:hypothetical protein
VIINKESTVSYFKACLKTAQLLEDYAVDDYKNILMPSRGAYPIYGIARDINYRLMKENLHAENRHQVFKDYHYLNSFTGCIWLPFTAHTGNQDEDSKSSLIRQSWVKVLKSYLDDQYSIERSTYEYINSHILKKDIYKDRLRIIKEFKLVYIDTVISGKAAFEILKAFEENSINDYKAILVVDRNGDKLKKEYKDYLYWLKNKNLIEFVYCSDLFTEDKGPSFGGITGMVFPTIMNCLPDFMGSDINGDIIGAGAWALEVSMRNDNSNRGITLANAELNFMFNHLILDHFSKFRKTNHGRDLLDYSIDRLNTLIREMEILNPETTRKILDPMIKGISDYDTEVSQSHVVRVNFSDIKTNKFIRNIERFHEKNIRS